MNLSLDIALQLGCFIAEKEIIKLMLHKRALRMIYNDQMPSFQELLDKDNSFTIHHFNIQSLAIEMFKVINNIAVTIIENLFTTYHSKNQKPRNAGNPQKAF